jgi:hypothetical protein
MSTNREFLKEAIADAKIVKETAIANAKLALEESFEPYLKQALALKLEEMDKSDSLEEEDVFFESSEEMDEMMKDKDLEELSLDEILSELEKESLNEEEGEEGEEEEGEEEVIDPDNLTDEFLKELIEDVIASMIEAGELEAGENFEEEEMGSEMEDEDEEINLELEEDEDLDEAKEKSSDIPESYGTKMRDMKETLQIRSLKKDLQEAFDTITTLKNELNEINLLNAKLLYVNKIFKSQNNLSENQKLKVIGAFDKATTVGEVKLVFESLNTHMKPSVSPKKHIVENVIKSASKSLNVNPKSTKEPILESNEMVSRFQKLAGIKII